MLFFVFRLGPFAIETIAVRSPRDNGAGRDARKGLASAVWLLNDRELHIGVCITNAMTACEGVFCLCKDQGVSFARQRRYSGRPYSLYGLSCLAALLGFQSKIRICIASQTWPASKAGNIYFWSRTASRHVQRRAKREESSLRCHSSVDDCLTLDAVAVLLKMGLSVIACFHKPAKLIYMQPHVTLT